MPSQLRADPSDQNQRQSDAAIAPDTSEGTGPIDLPDATQLDRLRELTREEFAAIKHRMAVRRAPTTAASTPAPLHPPRIDARVRPAPQSSGRKVQLNVRVDAELKNAIIAWARSQNCEVSEVVVAALTAHLLQLRRQS